MRECKICAAGPEGNRLAVDVMMGRKSATDVARMLGCTVDEVWQHIELHLDQSVVQKIVQEKSAGDEIVERVRWIIDLLVEKVEDINEFWSLDVGHVKALTALVKELRQALMDYAELMGEIERGKIIVQVQQVEQKVEQIVEVLLDEICDECRERVLAKLEAITT